MTASPRAVLDTNVLISAALTAGGKPRAAFEYVIASGLPLITVATHDELSEVIDRPRLQKYLVAADKTRFLNRLMDAAVWIDTLERITACRDPKDDKFLDAAVYGAADFIVSGDEDLLVLHPFRGVPILTPAAFLEKMTA